MSLAFNIIVAIAIVARLYYFRRSMLAAFPVNIHDDHYTNFAAIMIESSVITAAATLLCLVPLVRGNAAANIFLQPLGEIQVSLSECNQAAAGTERRSTSGYRDTSDRVPHRH